MDPNLSFASNDDPRLEWRHFWYNDADAWFRGKGYSILRPSPVVITDLDDSDDNEDSDDEDIKEDPLHLHEFPYPFPHFNTKLCTDPEKLRSQCHPKGPVAFGQDSEGRTVAFKFVIDDSEEYKCLRFVHSLELDEAKSACILPVLEFLSCDGHWFAVMPFWSQAHPPSNCKTLRDVLYLLNHMLKALSFLHKHKIFHRDIKLSNVLLNYIPFHRLEPCWSDEKYNLLQSNGQLFYSFIDFGESIKFPENYSYDQCRLPYRESWHGTYYMTDLAQGEFDFDPFAYDVGVLGIVFADICQNIIPQVPMLAPLLDKMLTWKVEERFTAPQALQFLEGVQADLTGEQLLSAMELKLSWAQGIECRDRWVGLPTEFVVKWAEYRIPAKPRWMTVLRAACGMHPWVLHSVAAIRKMFYSVRLQVAVLCPYLKPV